MVAYSPQIHPIRMLMVRSNAQLNCVEDDGYIDATSKDTVRNNVVDTSRLILSNPRACSQKNLRFPVTAVDPFRILICNLLKVRGVITCEKLICTGSITDHTGTVLLNWCSPENFICGPRLRFTSWKREKLAGSGKSRLPAITPRACLFVHDRMHTEVEEALVRRTSIIFRCASSS